MADACRRRFDAILVWKIDRFGRSLKHLVNSLAELAALGISFISLRDNLDLSTPTGRLMFQIIGAMAEFERALIQERVVAGLRNAQARGTRTRYHDDGALAGSQQSTQRISVCAQRLQWIRRSGSMCRKNTGGHGASPERKN
jgi:DNA invertase Pin-like site-specific DNA recombinase